MKMCNQLNKLREKSDYHVSKEELFEFFDISEEDAKLICKNHQHANGIENQIFEFSELHYAFQALIIMEQSKLMTSEQIAYAQYWVKAIYLALMRRSPRVKSQALAKQNVDDEGQEASDDESDKDDQRSVEPELNPQVSQEPGKREPTEAKKLLQQLNRHLLLNQYVIPHSISYVEVFLITMLRIGEIEIGEPDKLDEFGDYPCVKRLIKHIFS